MQTKVIFSPKLGQKAYIYHNDGTGRDTYISFNSGGNSFADYNLFPKSTQSELGHLPKPYFSQKLEPDVKQHRYRPDGKGRDNYIMFNQSGYDKLNVLKHESPNARFRHNLRKYDLRSSLIDEHNKTLTQLSRDLSVFQQIMEENNRILIPPIKPRRRGETRYQKSFSTYSRLS